MKKAKTIGEKSILFHKKHNGKLFTKSVIPVKNKEILSLIYTPGVGKVSEEINKNPKLAHTLTLKGRTVAVISDGSAVLGLGNIGALAAIPVMEGKSVLLRELAGVDSVPVVLKTQNKEEIIRTIEIISPTYGAILLEDFAAPNCFEIEKVLQEKLDIPVMHDDQHGTAMVVLAGLYNAVKVANKKINEVSVTIMGSGAAGIAIAKLLDFAGFKDIRMLDRKGILSKERNDLNESKKEIASMTNPKNLSGDKTKALENCDIFIGVSGANLISADDVKVMNKNAIIFALANPVPEIMPEVARNAGALVVATGRSDFANQINNAIIFPGFFKGLLKNPNIKVDHQLMVSVSKSVANLIKKPNKDKIIPSIFDKKLVPTIVKTIENINKRK